MSVMKSRLLLLFLLLASCGCRGEATSQTPSPASNPPPTAGQQPLVAGDDLLERQLAVDTLYFADDGRQLIAPGNRMRATVDPASRKLAWAAWQCDNPQCPGRKPDGTPQLFPWPDPFLFVKEDGSIGSQQPITEAELRQAEENSDVRCPACLKNRNLTTESAHQRQQFRLWCRLHVLPQAVEQRKKLEEEYRRLMGSHP